MDLDLHGPLFPGHLLDTLYRALAALHEVTYTFIDHLNYERYRFVIAATTPPHISHFGYGTPDDLIYTYIHIQPLDFAPPRQTNGLRPSPPLLDWLGLVVHG